MPENLSRKLIRNHLEEGELNPGESIALRMDQTLTQDATGTLVMLEFEAMNVDRVKTRLSAQYVDHNLLQEDHKNPDDHLFLRSACQKFGVHFSPPGTGVSHPVHMEHFGVPGETLVGSDSHTPAAGALGMLAFGAGGIEVALAMAGKPLHLKMPEIWGIRLTGQLPDWVSAKDVILELLQRHDVDGGVGRILEYYGTGLDSLTAFDRHVIANMGTELGATTSVFPSDDVVRQFLKLQDREDDWQEWRADEGAEYDHLEEVNLSELVPLIACPSSPGNVVPVSDVAGREIYQSYIGSSANPGLRDFAVPALMLEGRHIHDRVSFDVNPSSRQTLVALTEHSYLGRLIQAGARIHQTGCNGCIGMGQAPASGKISLRTVPRNFPGRSGTREDQVYLCSPETATASALRGAITDPRELDQPYPQFQEPEHITLDRQSIIVPGSPEKAVDLEKGPNIQSLPKLDPLPATLQGPILLKLGDDVSTDEIMPAGAKVLPFRSNIPKMSQFVFSGVDESYPERCEDHDVSCIVAGENYGQGSSREHAALAPRYLGLRLVLAISFARIHWQNLINFGVLPLEFVTASDYGQLDQEDELRCVNLRDQLEEGATTIALENLTKKTTVETTHRLSERQRQILLAGSILATAA